MDVLTGGGTTSLLEEDSKELFGKSFRKHMVATAKAKKEYTEVYRKSRVNNTEKKPLRKSLLLKKKNGGRFVSFSTSTFSRGQSASSSQSSQRFQPPWKSKRPFGKSFLNKEGNLSQPKTHFLEIVPIHQLKHMHSLVPNSFPKGEMGNFSLAGRLQ